MKSKVFSFIVFYCLLIIAIDTSSNIYRMISFPVQLGSFKVKNKVSLLNFQSTSRIQFLSELFGFIRPNYLYDIIWPLPLFGYDHLFDRIIFKAVHFDTNGNRAEPYKYFNDNGSKADNFILNERFLLSDFTITHNTRIKGGRDAASPRYIWTEFAELTSLIFRKEDEQILDYMYEDGLRIEPECYYPIIPMVLVNGAEGIGTGFSTKCPQFNPVDIINNIINMIVIYK